MNKIQAIVIACEDARFSKALEEFLDSPLNLYSVSIKNSGIKNIIEEGSKREEIFAFMEDIFKNNGTERVILFGHQDCSDFGGSEAFLGLDDEQNRMITQVRHAVSVLHAKFPNINVEAYLALLSPSNQVSFKRVV